jgi:hypothetical protein
MRRLVGPMPFLLIALTDGCTCRAAPSSAPIDASPSMTGIASAVQGATPSEAVFSAPIAAVRAGGVQVVAGLVAAESVVRVIGSRGGHASWTADVLGKVAWAPDAEIKLSAAGDGVALVARGLGAKNDRSLVLLGPHGEQRGVPIDVGSAFCATTDGLAWVDPRPGGAVSVRARAWSEVEARDVVTIASERRPALVCGDHQVFVLGDGDDDLTVTAFVPGDPSAKHPIVAIRDADFHDDEEREHDTYTMGDDLGLLRVASSGSIAIREIHKAGDAAPWRRLKHSLSEDDDVVAVDGDATATLVVFTHETDDACPGVGSTAEGVHALRVDRVTGEESALDLARPDCDRSPGPFWIASAPGAPVVAWVERATKLSPNAAAIRGLATRTLRATGVSSASLDIQADALVDGGCDDSGCFVAALVRQPGSDGMRSAPIVAVAYP